MKDIFMKLEPHHLLPVVYDLFITQFIKLDSRVVETIIQSLLSHVDAPIIPYPRHERLWRFLLKRAESKSRMATFKKIPSGNLNNYKT